MIQQHVANNLLKPIVQQHVANNGKERRFAAEDWTIKVCGWFSCCSLVYFSTWSPNQGWNHQEKWDLNQSMEGSNTADGQNAQPPVVVTVMETDVSEQSRKRSQQDPAWQYVTKLDKISDKVAALQWNSANNLKNIIQQSEEDKNNKLLYDHDVDHAQRQGANVYGLHKATCILRHTIHLE